MTSFISRVEEFKKSLKVEEYKQTYEDLHEDVTDMEVGDVCWVADEFTLNGREYDGDTYLVWTGSEWQVLEGPELTQEEMDEIGKRLVWMTDSHKYGRYQKIFCGEVERFSDCFEGLQIFTGWDEDSIEAIKEDNPDFDGEGLDEWTVEDNGGNVFLTGREEIEARTGDIDLVSEHRYVKELSKLYRDDYEAIVKELRGSIYDYEIEIYQYAKRKLEEYRQNG